MERHCEVVEVKVKKDRRWRLLSLRTSESDLGMMTRRRGV